MSKKKKSKNGNQSETGSGAMNTVSSNGMTGAIPANPKQTAEDCKKEDNKQ